MQAKFGWTESQAGQVYAIFLAVVYFAPLLGGMLADKIGYGKCVTIGFATMFFGYLGLAIPTGANDIGKAAMFAGLACVSLGTGLFSRDSAFSLFYMAINIGAMFAPSMAKWITNIYLRQYGFVYEAGNFDPAYLHTLYGAYGLCFGVACISLILSAIFILPAAVGLSMQTLQPIKQKLPIKLLKNSHRSRRKIVSLPYYWSSLL